MARSAQRKTGRKHRQPTMEVVDITIDELDRLIERIEKKALLNDDYDLLLHVLQSYDYVLKLLQDDKVKLKRLKRLLFGTTESFDKVVSPAQEADAESSADEPSGGDADAETDSDKSTPKGHGRNGADEYTGAEQEFVEHDTLQGGDPCPECGEGRVYEIPPKVVVRISGQPPVGAKIYRMQRLRCKVCGTLFHATPPADAQGQKYDESAATMIGLLKYGSGLPFNRLKRLEGNVGVPLPASTQWQVVAARAPGLRPIYEALIHEVATWDLFHNDDTTIKVLEKIGLKAPPVHSSKDTKERTGTFTSTVVARKKDRDAALFFSGRLHAGENLMEILRHRPDELVSPIQMCDALSRSD